jgi:hypothetical protein
MRQGADRTVLRGSSRSVTAGDIEQGIVLVNNATETARFNTLASVASAVCFTAERLSFWHPDKDPSTPTQAQAIVYAGPDPDAFGQRFAAVGNVWVPWVALLRNGPATAAAPHQERRADDARAR